ncbi:hypothetical protein pdul_cds_473 [Pandoravirus dulcis]|uniref:Uncharacterized protein n=1 Tax=Pandoravirus dulcis TaxID=1349409 RepID=S4VT27_9VIRU|nr:hypothetical protein pdul_cds_473 [Pandoravirus dulcis]AGO82550.1 hypothetical protein pdul_cds_473 [Pandoravirus dulcis]
MLGPTDLPTDAADADIVSRLPRELWAAIAEAPGVRTEDVARLAAATRSLRWLASEQEGVRRRAALRATAGPCADYLGCVGALTRAIADDDADTVAALVDSGRIPINEPIDLEAVDKYSGWQTRLDAASDLPPWNSTLSALPHARYWGTLPAGSPYAIPLSVAVAAGAQRSAARLMRLGAGAWPSPETLLSYAVRMPLATRVRSVTQWFDGMSGYDPDAPTVHGPWRDIDTRAMVQRIARTYPRSPRLGPWDDSPLATLLNRVGQGMAYYSAAHGGDALAARVTDLAEALLQAGYSPDERAFAEARVPTGRDNPSVRELTRQRLYEAEDRLETRIANMSEEEEREIDDVGDGGGPWASRERAAVAVLGALNDLYDLYGSAP